MTSTADHDLPVLQLDGDVPFGRFVIEASAGTGKTYSLTALVARYVAEWGLRPEQLLMVTFTRSAAADMSHRTRLQIRELVRALQEVRESGAAAPREGLDPWMKAVITADPVENALRLQRLEAFLSSYDETTITTIHGFFQIVLNRVGLKGPVHGDVTLVEDVGDIVRQVVADILIGELAHDPDVLLDQQAGGKTRKGTSIQKELVAAAQAVVSNLGATMQPDCQTVDFETPLDQLPVEKRWAVLVSRVVQAAQERLDRSDLLGFDRMVTAVLDMVEGPDGSSILVAVRDQFRVVLVDEFQDTDQMQWRILSRFFASASNSDPQAVFGTVGDPKQAIYRFRGADIEAYRAAVAGVEQTSALTTNYRSNERLITAVNRLFAGTHFGADDIVYRSVRSRTGTENEGVVGSPALEIRWVPFSDELGSGFPKTLNKAEREALAVGTLDKWNLNKNEAMEAIYADVAREIAALLHTGQLVDKKGAPRPIKPGDIAILVPAHSQAERLFTVLSLAGVPAMRYRSQSVFESRAAQDWQILLEALCRPTHSGVVRACMISAFGDTTVQQLAAWDDMTATTEVAKWQQRSADWAARLQREGLAAVYHHIRSRHNLEAGLVSQVGGERLLTDLDHIAEVLARRPGLQRGSTPADYRREMLALRLNGNRIDEYQRRIESDDDAVHLATIHFSKGLEYPIVFLPAMFKSGEPQEPWVYNVDGQRFIDVAHKVAWTDVGTGESSEIRKERSAQADLGDAMRKLYVAATRAEQKLILYWTTVQGSVPSALGRVLFGRDEHGAIRIDPELQAPIAKDMRSNAGLETELNRLVAIDGSLKVISVEPSADLPIGLRASTPEKVAVSEARLSRLEPLKRDHWRKWSYSKVVEGRHEGMSRRIGEGRNSDGRAGKDEPGEVEDLVPPMTLNDTALKNIGITADTLPAVLFPDGLRGTTFGSMVHMLFEQLDPAAANFGTQLAAALTKKSWSLLPSMIPTLSHALEQVTHTPLGPLFGERSLAMISSRDRLAEAKFDLQLPQTESISLDVILALLERHLVEGDPFQKYAEWWTGSTPQLSGSLYGEIDAVFRVAQADGSPRYIVSDYKTNLLHGAPSVAPTGDALAQYSPDRLAQAMMSNDYVIQALLYSVALHRYLSLRQPGYEIDQHFGGVAYLFVRGMIGAETPRTTDGQPFGVFTWRPPSELITDIDELFSSETNRVSQ